MVQIKLDKVSKVYKGDKGEKVKAVTDFSLESNAKEFIVFVGPSGCGKSTTLRMIAGLEEITSGNFYIDGERMNDIEAQDRNIAMVFQNYALYPHMTAYQNMAFGLKNRKASKEEIDRRIKDAARILDIEKLLNRKPKNMSGGQRQRVALGRALVRTPKLFLLDEPLSNLDAKLRAQMRVEISKLYEKLDTTFIYVTHDQIEAMTMGTRIVVMREGVIQQTGTPTEIYDYPANRFVAGFLGTPQMNFFESQIAKTDQGFVLRLPDGGKLPLTGKKMRKIKPLYEDGNNHPVIVGVRPEHLHIGEEGEFHCQVNLSEILGSETLLYCASKKSNAPQDCNRHDIVIKIPQRLLLKNGTDIALTIEEDKIQLFDADSEVSVLADEKGEFSSAPALEKKSEPVQKMPKTKKWWPFLKRKGN